MIMKLIPSKISAFEKVSISRSNHLFAIYIILIYLLHKIQPKLALIMYLKAFMLTMFCLNNICESTKEVCHLRPVIHVLQHPGCVPKPIPSFACHGICSSYVQVSGSKFWQVERSCMCCQEMGEREASIAIFCPKQIPRFRKIVTRAPVDCMCRPCTGIDESSVQPQEIVNLMGKNADIENMDII